jgi:probable HAF family extracellular repeat protein
MNSSGKYHAFHTAPNSPINHVTDDLGTLAGLDNSRVNGVNAVLA